MLQKLVLKLKQVRGVMVVVVSDATALPAYTLTIFMKRLLDLSVHSIPWLMLILAALTLVTMIVVLMQKKHQDRDMNR